MRPLLVSVPFLACAAVVAFAGIVSPKAEDDSVEHWSVLQEKPDGERTSLETKVETLCARMHNNTAFIGIDPFLLLRVATASECQKGCMELYPHCTAVVFYYIYNERKDHMCYLFSKNSVDEQVALVPEKPANKKDIVRALELAVNCHEFDPFPPLADSFVMSTDKVTRDKRESGYDRQVVVTGPWTSWTSCDRSRNQIRTQSCEYGRKIQKRQCSPRYPQSSAPRSQSTRTNGYQQQMSSYQQQTASSSYQQQTASSYQQQSSYNQQPYQPTSQPQTRYPPQPYVHPSSTSDEYSRRMEEHQRQVQDACCYKQQSSANGLQVHPAVPSASPCPQVCPPRPQAVNMAPQQFIPPPTYSRPITAAWSSWTTWSICSATCGSGTQQRTRSCDGGRCPGEATDQRPCELRPCNLWSDWCEWSQCRATCGTGERTRTRYCELGTMRCEGPDYEVDTCEADPCPEWTEWCEWTGCSATCGGGTNRRYRTCTGGYCPGEGMQQMPCNLEACPCWSEWGPFMQCSVSCGAGGFTSRQRTCIGGTGSPNDCPGEPVEEVPCPTPVPCPEWSEWEDWSTCSVTCGHGTLTRQRNCLGSYCPGERIETVPCDLPSCSFWSQWQEWSPCTATCGDGMKHRKRVCQYGTDCAGTDEETLFCNGPPCSSWTEWGDWSPCNVECGTGQKNRDRQCLASNGAPSEDCLGYKQESVLCEERPCCHWTEWCPWTNCDRDCGGGKMTRERFCQRPGFSGEFDDTCSCPGADREERECNTQACAPQCQWTEWCPWSSCSTPDACRPGVATRSRQCVGEAGCSCYGFAEETRTCRTEELCLPPPPPPTPAPC